MIAAIPLLLAVAVSPDGCHKIQKELILARDVAAVIPLFGQVPGDFNLGYLPASGEPRVLRGVDLERIAKNQKVELTGLQDVCFARATFVPESVQLNDAMLAELKRTEPSLVGAKIEILSWSQHSAPVGELVFPRAGLQLPPSSGTQRDILWNGYVLYDKDQRLPLWAKVRITASITRVVATTSILVGKTIQANQVRLETLQDFPFDEALTHSLDEVVGSLSKISLHAGSSFYRTQLERNPDVTRGALVIVEVFAGGAHLRLEARAESAGVIGSTIAVRNLSSGKEFRAQVTGKNHATVGVAAVDKVEIQSQVQ